MAQNFYVEGRVIAVDKIPPDIVLLLLAGVSTIILETVAERKVAKISN
jgi:hypothetical protein